MTKPALAVRIRKLLREEDYGMTVKELVQMLEAPNASIYEALTNMPDTYIDRWTETNRYVTSEAVWCVVVPPPNTPRPERNVAHD